MQFNLNIDRYSAAYRPSSKRRPGRARPDGARESFDRHLEQARRRPADRDRRPAADDAGMPRRTRRRPDRRTNRPNPKPKGRHRTRGPMRRRVMDRTRRDRATKQRNRRRPIRPRANRRLASRSQPRRTWTSKKPTTPSKPRRNISRSPPSPRRMAKRLAISPLRTKPSFDPNSWQTKVRGSSSRGAKAVAGNAAVEAGIAPTDTVPSNEANPTSTTKTASAAGPDVSLDVGRLEVAPAAAADARRKPVQTPGLKTLRSPMRRLPQQTACRHRASPLRQRRKKVTNRRRPRARTSRIRRRAN